MILSQRLAAYGLVALALACASPAIAQRTPLYQSGTWVSRDAVKVTTQGTLTRAGGLEGDALGYGLNPTSITDSLAVGLSVNSGPTSAAYWGFGLGHDASGNALMTIDAFGGATPKDFIIRKNGIDYIWPGTGAGTIVGPVTTTVNEPVVWNNTAGTLSKNGFGVAIAHSDTKTAAITSGSGSAWTTYSNIADTITGPQIWAWVNRPPGSSTDDGPYDVARCVLTPPAGTTKIVGCHGAYVVSGALGGVGSVGYIGEFIADAEGASVWGFNYLFGDNRGWEDTTNGSTTNRSFFNEIDFIITSPHTQGIGLLFGGSSRAQPGLTGFGVSAINLGRLDGYPGTGNVAKWNAFLGTTPGSTRIFAGINQIEPTAAFTATFGGTVMTVTAISSGIVGADPISGAIINATAVAAGTRVQNQITPLTGGESYGGLGRYTISAAHTLGSRAVITGSDSQAILFSGYNSAGIAASTAMQLLSSGDFLINAPISVVLEASNNPVITAKLAVAVFGSTVTDAVHINSAQLTAPALSLCGTSPAIVGTDTGGRVTMGTGSPTGCVIAFNRAYVAAPVCTVTWRATPLASQGYTTSTLGITLTQTGTSSNIVDYVCLGIGDS